MWFHPAAFKFGVAEFQQTAILKRIDGTELLVRYLIQ
jgi:hypothetical protein